MNSKAQAVTALAVFLVIALIVYSNTQKPVVEAPAQQTATSSVTSVNNVMEKSFKNGVYTVKGEYVSPAGAEEIDISITLQDGMVKDTAAKVLAENEKSQFFQNKFVESYKTVVVGKKVAELASLSVIGGASLTTKGFKDAVLKIETQATIQ